MGQTAGPWEIEAIKAVAQLLWPLLVGGLLVALFPALKAIITSRAFSVKIAGMEVSVQNATEQFQTQIADLQKQVLLMRAGTEPERASPARKDPARPEIGRERPRLLWVDDKPSGNALELAQIADLGIEVTQAVSTGEALNLVNSGARFDGVISDMGRREEGRYVSQAGLMLLKALRDAGYNGPFFVYSSQRAAARNNIDVKESGGDGATSSPLELLEWVHKRFDNLLRSTVSTA
ncbi:MAG: response regulator [Methylobacteriaceae bacterium]|nr:response regulator [Methylobacteriaceae bacterium]